MKKRKPDIHGLLKFARKSGVFKAGEAIARGFHYTQLERLCKKELLIKIARGFYRVPDAQVSSHYDLAIVGKAVPGGIVCLISALSFHEIGTQIPHDVWIMINNRAAHPRVNYPTLRVIRSSGKPFTEGIQEHEIDGVRVQIYNPAKTVVDCFKFRNKVGLEVALEALREALGERKCTFEELWNYARICRVTNIMRPYMEAMQ